MDLTEPQLRQALTASLAVDRWVDDVAARAPFPSLAALLDVARHAATPLTELEIDLALAHHPRIGERAAVQGLTAALSRSEQAGMRGPGPDGAAADEAGLDRAIAAGNAAYEARFGRVFLIRAAGRSRADVLAELHRRVELPDEVELAVVEDQLREIAAGRLAALLDDHARSHQLLEDP